MPKKIKKTSIDAEDRSLKFNEFVENIDKRTMEKISTSIGNIQILSREGNSTKSNKIPIKYCEYDELNKCIAIKLDDALQDIDKNKNTIVNNIEYLINKI